MKKAIISVVLCVALCLCLALPAFADEISNGSHDVNITINGEVVHTYSVDIEFTNTVFTYSSGAKWDPDSYTYKYTDAPVWAGEGTVTIINHSDLPVNYKVEKASVETKYGPLDIFVTDNGNGTIAKCEVGMTKNQQNATATFAVSGTPTVSEITAQKLGEIKVTISTVD